MFQRKTRKFRGRPNGRNRMLHGNGGLQTRLRSNPFQNDQMRNNFRTPQSAEKLFEKYSSLAKEAMTSGDKILSENYFQHADHFIRIIDNKNRSQSQSKPNLTDKTESGNKELSQNKDVTQKNTTDNDNKE